MDGLIDKIILASIALLVFSAIAGTVLSALANITGGGAVVQAVVPLVGFMFVVGVLLALYYGFVKKGR
jgi:hypothetical protein